jgi:hypothetical protein
MSRYVSEGADVEGSASEDEEEDDDTASQHRAQGNEGPDASEGEDMEEDNADNNADNNANASANNNRHNNAGQGRVPASNESRRAQNVAAIEGVASEVQAYMTPLGRSQMIWRGDIDRFSQTDIPDDWKAWGRVPDAREGHLKLREAWLGWMACTSKLLQTVHNHHLNSHQDYQYSGPTINFVDLQTTPQVGRRLQILSHIVECINNFGEFPLDCVVPTKETEIIMGTGRGGKLVRGMRMKNPDKKVAREVELTSTNTSRGVERWIKSFNRGIDTEEDLDGEDVMGDADGGGNTEDKNNGMVETQIVRLVVRIFPVVHEKFKGLGRVISLIGLPGVNIAKCLQRVTDPRYYDTKHGDLGRSREALFREVVYSEFGVLEAQMRHDDMEGRLCDFDNYHDYKYHVFHFCSEVNARSIRLV